MYEQHFGLKKRPFRANASGTDVFVGPQIATILAGLKKALANNDAIVTVSGPVGSGKTTLVNRALESIGCSSKVIRLARMRLESKDVLEFLLDELGVEDRPNGIIQKFSLFRRRLKELETANTRVFIAVEDTHHLGSETLAELEALTAGDAGDSEGASVILMGNEGLDKFLLDPQLARVKQRIRHRYSVAPLCAAELRGYLRHCFRLAGGDFERLFEVNAAPLLHHLSGGVLRTANQLIDSAMAAAHDQDLGKVSSRLLARVSENEFGLSANGFDLSAQPAPLPVLTPEAVTAAQRPPPPVIDRPAPIAIAEPVAIAKPEVIPRPVATPQAEAPPMVSAEPAKEAAVEVAADSPAEIEIPELIQDTLPDLQILAPALAGIQPESEIELEPQVEPQPAFEFAAEVEPEPEPEPEPESIAIPELTPVLQAQPRLDNEPKPVIERKIPAESDGDEVPAWDRDPTVAELRPDIEALEAALAFGRSDEPDPVKVDPVPPPKPIEPEVIPEITLDHAISQRIADNLIDEPGEISAPAPKKPAQPTLSIDKPVQKPTQKTSQKADAELEKIASELAKAKSLEDVDDRMAETLFGDEINFVAAQFMARQPRELSANDDDDKPAVVSETKSTASNSDEDDDGPGYEVTLQATRKLDDGGMDLSASQRLKTVRALNADLSPSRGETKPAAAVPAPAPAVKPDPIEDQINTSMTQTLKALNVRPPVNDDDIDDGDSKRGFFSRFKRS